MACGSLSVVSGLACPDQCVSMKNEQEHGAWPRLVTKHTFLEFQQDSGAKFAALRRRCRSENHIGNDSEADFWAALSESTQSGCNSETTSSPVSSSPGLWPASPESVPRDFSLDNVSDTVEKLDLSECRSPMADEDTDFFGQSRSEGDGSETSRLVLPDLSECLSPTACDGTGLLLYPPMQPQSVQCSIFAVPPPPGVWLASSSVPRDNSFYMQPSTTGCVASRVSSVERADDRLESLCNHQAMQKPAPSKKEKKAKKSKASEVEKMSDDVVDRDNLTTLMLRNLPNEMNRDMLTDLLDFCGFRGLYDFVYAPMDFARAGGLGYAFVNLVSHDDADRLRKAFQGFVSWPVKSAKVCQVDWSNPMQGYDAHVDRYRNSPVMSEGVPDEYRPVIFCKGVRVAFPPPTRRIRAPRLKHGHVIVGPTVA